MKDPYGEGIAGRTGPESCAGNRKGVGEALTGGGMGRVSSRETSDIRGADAVGRAEGHTGCAASARCNRTLRGLRPRARSDHFLRGNREIPCPTVNDGDTVRAANPTGAMRR